MKAEEDHQEEDVEEVAAVEAADHLWAEAAAAEEEVAAEAEEDVEVEVAAEEDEEVAE